MPTSPAFCQLEPPRAAGMDGSEICLLGSIEAAKDEAAGPTCIGLAAIGSAAHAPLLKPEIPSGPGVLDVEGLDVNWKDELSGEANADADEAVGGL